MREDTRKETDFVRISSRLKYIAFGAFAVLIAGFSCAYFWIQREELILREMQEEALARIYAVRQSIRTLDKQLYVKQAAEVARELENEIESSRNMAEKGYLDSLEHYNRRKRMILIGLFCILLSTQLFTLLYSHRLGTFFSRQKDLQIGK